MKLINCCLVIYFLISLTSCNTSLNSESKFLIGGSGWQKIAKIDLNGKLLWDHDLEKNEECNSVSNLPNNRVLYSFKKGFKIVDEEHNVLWAYQAREKAEIHSASLTREGNVLIGECGNPAKIYEFTAEGEKIIEIDFETGLENPHGQFRRVRKTSKGTYLVPVFGKRKVFEIDSQGKIVKETKFDFFIFSIVLLENANWLLSCGDDHKLVEYNPFSQEIVWELNDKDIEEFPLLFVAEAVRLKNGNTIVCNWAGHSHTEGPKVQFFEIDQNKKVVWKVEDSQNLGQISTLDPDIHQEYLR